MVTVDERVSTVSARFETCVIRLSSARVIRVRTSAAVGWGGGVDMVGTGVAVGH